MSIVSLVKVTAYGHIDDKAQVLEGLQDIGCLHLISLNPERDIARRDGPSSEAREALQFLLSCPQRRKQVRNPVNFDPVFIEREAIALKKKIKAFEDERDFLLERIANLAPWGDFQFPPRKELGNYRFWFYLVPHYQMKDVEASDLIWQVVKHDNRFYYVIVISQQEPEGMPVPRVRTGNISLSELERRLEDVETDLEDLQAERESLTKWCTIYAQNLDRVEDLAAREEAAQQTYDDEDTPVFALQAWAPAHARDRLRSYAMDKGIALEIEELSPEDNPPTLLENKSSLASGQDLVLFYMTPGYRLWDPSIVVFFSFVLFFAMILSDAGYGLLMAGFLLLYWKRMGHSDTGRRFRVLLAWLTGASVGWGIMIGSYFGITPPPSSTLAALKILDNNNYSVMMLISILLGVSHLVIANAADAWRKRDSVEAMSSVGWILIFLGGLLTWLSSTLGTGGFVSVIKYLGILSMIVGAGGILWFTTPGKVWWKRLIFGLQGFTRVSSAFGDTLSYLRLFALGLAGSSLSITFNGLAGKIDESVPGIGILFAIVIVLFGHTLNLVLSIASGVIHGLRLNFIEFFNWSLPEEGHLFKAFARKEKVTWKE